MDVKIFPAPTHLMAVFEQQSPSHEKETVSCLLVALVETEFGQLRAMCAVPEHEYFVPLEEVQPHLHRIYGGLYHFLRYDYAEPITPNTGSISVAV